MPQREDYILRPIEEKDLGKVLAWRNSDRIRANMYTDHKITMDEHKAWFKGLKEKQNSVYMVFELNQRPIGLVYFKDIDQKNEKCLFGFYLGEDDLPRGTGTIMGVLGLKYVFENLDIRKLYGEAFAFNQSSINFFRRLGFTEEGRFTKHVLKSGKYEDVVIFALFKEDWQSNRDKLDKIAFF